jgi:hypothetical protein
MRALAPGQRGAYTRTPIELGPMAPEAIRRPHGLKARVGQIGTRGPAWCRPLRFVLGQRGSVRAEGATGDRDGTERAVEHVARHGPRGPGPSVALWHLSSGR